MFKRFGAALIRLVVAMYGPRFVSQRATLAIVETPKLEGSDGDDPGSVARKVGQNLSHHIERIGRGDVVGRIAKEEIQIWAVPLRHLIPGYSKDGVSAPLDLEELKAILEGDLWVRVDVGHCAGVDCLFLYTEAATVDSIPMFIPVDARRLQ